MPLGICTRYQHCEATIAALRLADWAVEAGHEVSIYPVTSSRGTLMPQWDSVVEKARRLRFTTWAARQTTIIWTHCPILGQITWPRDRGIQTGILCFWDEIRHEHIEVYRAADFVLSPSHLVHSFVTKILNARRAVDLPWDTGEPFTKKDPRLRASQVWVLLPLFDYEPYRVEATALEVAGRALLRNPDMVLTVPYNASKIAPFAVRRLKQFRNYFGNRVRLLPSIPLARRAMLYASHDLTYWPVCEGSIGLPGLTSVTMGTPVVSFAVPLFSEFLGAANSVQAPVVSHGMPQGLQHTEPDYDAMDVLLQTTVADPDAVRNLQQSVLSGLAERRKVFGAVLTRTVR